MPSFADSSKTWPSSYRLPEDGSPLDGNQLFKWATFGFLNGATASEVAVLVKVATKKIEEIYEQLQSNKYRYYSYSLQHREYRFLNGRRKAMVTDDDAKDDVAKDDVEPKTKKQKLEDTLLYNKMMDLCGSDSFKGGCAYFSMSI